MVCLESIDDSWKEKEEAFLLLLHSAYSANVRKACRCWDKARGKMEEVPTESHISTRKRGEKKKRPSKGVQLTYTDCNTIINSF
ncbi:hypothetical protein ACE6H2_021022 [Prunus campanulata]